VRRHDLQQHKTRTGKLFRQWGKTKTQEEECDIASKLSSSLTKIAKHKPLPKGSTDFVSIMDIATGSRMK
jgi:hypothetical protein